MVGNCGASWLRVDVVTAMARSRPALTKAWLDARSTTMKSSCPAATSAIAGGELLYGTAVESSFISLTSAAPATWPGVLPYA